MDPLPCSGSMAKGNYYLVVLNNNFFKRLQLNGSSGYRYECPLIVLVVAIIRSIRATDTASSQGPIMWHKTRDIILRNLTP